MSYRGRLKGTYGNPSRRSSFGSGSRRNKPPGFSSRDIHLAQAAFAGRSPKSRAQDLSRQAPLVDSLEVWLKSPASLDIPGIDSKLSMNPKEQKKQAATLAEIAKKKKNVEIEVRDPKEKKSVKRFKVVTKDEAEKLKKEQEQKVKIETPEKTELKPKENDANSPLVEGHKMPSKAEILERAKQLYMHDNARFPELGENLPEESELREEGYLKRAQTELLTKEDTKTTHQVLDYVGTLKNELEQIGFTIVPIEGFTL